MNLNLCFVHKLCIGLEDISLADENECGVEEEEMGGCNFGAEHVVNGFDELEQINFKNISPDDIMMYHFPDCGVAYICFTIGMPMLKIFQPEKARS